MNTKMKQQILILLGILLFYWGAMTLIPVPGQGYPSLEKGQDIGAWIDRLFLTGHMWSQSKTWDPEGLFSTIPAVGTCLAGVLAGEWIKSKTDMWQKWSAIFAAGFLLFLLGLLWGEVFPINKPLWTSSYVVLHSGLALLTLGTVWWLVDVKGFKWWTKPFIWFGMNPLFIFALHGIISKLLNLIKVGDLTGGKWLFQNVFASWLGPYNASLAYAIFMVLINLLVAWFLWKRKIVIKV
jgi:predicted acyltransferase